MHLQQQPTNIGVHQSSRRPVASLRLHRRLLLRPSICAYPSMGVSAIRVPKSRKRGVRPIYSCPLSLLPPVPSPPLQSLACPSLPCHFIPSLLFPMPPSLQSIQLRSLEDLHARLCRMHRVCRKSFESRFDEINILTRNQHAIQMLGLFWQESLMVLDTDMDPREPLTKYLKLTLLW